MRGKLPPPTTTVLWAPFVLITLVGFAVVLDRYGGLAAGGLRRWWAEAILIVGMLGLAVLIARRLGEVGNGGTHWIGAFTSATSALVAIVALTISAVALDVSREELRITEREHLTNRMDRASGLVRSADVAERADGVREYGQLMHEFPDSQTVIVERLTAFVRDHAPTVAAPQPAGDIQAALSELGRRPAELLYQGRQISAYGGAVYLGDYTGELIDLHGLDLRGALLRDGRLPFVNLSGANLSGAEFAGTNLVSADLSGAVLAGADLTGANLDLTDLTGVDLRSARGLTADQLACAVTKGAKLPPLAEPPSGRACPSTFDLAVVQAPTPR